MLSSPTCMTCWHNIRIMWLGGVSCLVSGTWYFSSEAALVKWAFIQTITIFNGCEVWTENWKQLPEWRNFQFAPNNRYRFFFLHTLPLTIVFKCGYALFDQFYAEIRTFVIKKCLISLLAMNLMSCMRSFYTLWYKTEISRMGENGGKPSFFSLFFFLICHTWFIFSEVRK